jgi:type IV fimbrial biogenesis protein FimT
MMHSPGVEKNKGFTLIELMIVLAVISILVMVTAPKYQGLKVQYRLEAAAQNVVSELGYAKQYAMDHRKEVSVILTDSEVQVMENGIILDSKQFETGIKFDSSQIRNQWLEDSIHPTTNQLLGKGLIFDKRGFNTLSGTIVITHSSGRTVEVKIEDKTGYLSIIWP